MSNNQSADQQSEYIIETVDGPNVRMLPHKAKKTGNTWYSLTNPSTGNAAPFGLPVDAAHFPKGLPTEVKFQGQTLPLAATVTKPNPKTGSGGGNPSRRFEDKVKVHGEERILKVIFTESKDGSVNVTASMRRPSGNGGGRKLANVASGAIG